MHTPMHNAEERVPPCEDEVRAQVVRILSDPSFPGAGRCGAFLRYITEEAISGRAKRIKGYTIAIEVFGRDEGFSQDDPVVRIEAGRLRRALELYYAVAGRNDPVLINVPKGGYVPSFTRVLPEVHEVVEPIAQTPPVVRPVLSARRALMVSAVAAICAVGMGLFLMFNPGNQPNDLSIRGALPNGPTLVVAPFSDLGGGPESRLYAAGLTEELLTALPRFKEIKVFGRETTAGMLRGGTEDIAGQETGARFLLAGGVRVSESQVRVTARLLDTVTMAILWSDTYDGDLNTRSLFSIQTEVADKVATAVAQPYGIIAQTDSAHFPPSDIDAYACTLRFYAYRAELSVEQHADVRACLESAVEKYPNYSTAWAMLSMVHLDEDRFRYNRRPNALPATERSLEAARMAVQLDPANARGLQALMTALFFNRQPQESLRVGEQALAVNPNDTELLSEFGSRLALSGQWKRGASVLEEALSRNPGAAGYYRGVLALAEYMQGNYAKAASDIRQANVQKFPLFHIVAAVIYAERGMTEEAKLEREAFALMGSDYLVDLTEELQTRLGRPEDRVRILAGLKKAGLEPQDYSAGGPIADARAPTD